MVTRRPAGRLAGEANKTRHTTQDDDQWRRLLLTHSLTQGSSSSKPMDEEFCCFVGPKRGMIYYVMTSNFAGDHADYKIFVCSLWTAWTQKNEIKLTEAIGFWVFFTFFINKFLFVLLLWSDNEKILSNDHNYLQGVVGWWSVSSMDRWIWFEWHGISLGVVALDYSFHLLLTFCEGCHIKWLG